MARIIELSWRVLVEGDDPLDLGPLLVKVMEHGNLAYVIRDGLYDDVIEGRHFELNSPEVVDVTWEYKRKLEGGA